MSLCHGSALEEIKEQETDAIETIDVVGLDPETVSFLVECKEIWGFNRVELILHLTQSLIIKALDDGILKIGPPILSRVYQTLSRGFVNLLNAKKITDTRFPFPYAQLIAVLLLLSVILTPLMVSAVFKSIALVTTFTFVPIFGVFSLNFIASELENPFGNDDNDLPLQHFQSEMNNSLLMLLHSKSDHIASLSPNCEYESERSQVTTASGVYSPRPSPRTPRGIDRPSLRTLVQYDAKEMDSQGGTLRTSQRSQSSAASLGSLS